MTFYYKDLSFKIIGILQKVYNQEGYGFREKYYEDIITDYFKEAEVDNKRQSSIKIKTASGKIIYRLVDFEIESKMLLELKVGKRLTKKDFDQANEYLLSTGYHLCLLVLFNPSGVEVRRVINDY